MIIRTLTVVVLTFAALSIPNAARGDLIGPVCWKLGNDETYRLFFMVDFANPVAAPVVGEAVASGVGSFPVSGSAIVHTAAETVSMVLTVGQGSTGSTAFFVRADFSLGDPKGKAVCQLANGEAGGCGMGPRDWTPVTCP